INLRSEIEADLMTGAIATADLPHVWNAKMRETLDIEVPDDTRGVLQDVHWSHGYVGSFPTYTLGNVMSSQLFAAAQDRPGVSDGLAQGDYKPLFDDMRDNVWSYGRSSTPEETLVRATGRGLDTAPYIADLTAKVEDLTS
ncbi:MAG: carboxypeptidase M32, partial [Alphaproteobacteria bacterium]|nr:carboxypeptidase M32 [Alphaproteobacteria bacterium]